MAVHDMICGACGKVTLDQPVAKKGSMCYCGGTLDTYYGNLAGRRQMGLDAHPGERTVLYHSAREDKWQYPATNGPMPDRLRARGYERVEFPTLASLKEHERTTGTLSHAVHYDRGEDRE